MSARLVTAGDVTLSVTDRGQGQPLLLVHAFPLSARMWAPQLEAVPSGWRLIAPDLRGLGASPAGAVAPRHVRDHAADLLSLIDSLQCGPVVLAGLSMGGYIAFECWRQRPALIRALVLADTRADPDSDESRARRQILQQLAAEAGTGAVVDAMLPTLLGATSQACDPHLAVQVRAWAMENTAAGVIDALEVLRTRPDSRPDLAASPVRCWPWSAPRTP
ncbi:MAG: alpha/beta fold hydrolase [Acidobacteria bacterium]|nr:alpha/beta fold hydrolase [Acidobacteriota bacterium]